MEHAREVMRQRRRCRVLAVAAARKRRRFDLERTKTTVTLTCGACEKIREKVRAGPQTLGIGKTDGAEI